MACKRSAVRSRLPPPLSCTGTSACSNKAKQLGQVLSPSSRGLGHHPFTVSTGVRIPVGTPVTPLFTLVKRGFVFLSLVFRFHETPQEDLLFRELVFPVLALVFPPDSGQRALNSNGWSKKIQTST